MDFAQNELETALVAAAQDVAARPAFYEALLRSQVLAVNVGAPLDSRSADAVVELTVAAGTKLALAAVDRDGTPHTAFFSSSARLAPGTQFISMACTDFLRLTTGSHLVLNPGSPYGKAFNPEEIAALLDGSLLRPVSSVTIQKAEKQLIGQPADYPHAFAQTVARYLATEPAVERAFLAQHFVASLHEEPTLLVAVDVPQPDFERISAAIGVIAKDPSGPRRALDVTRVDRVDPGYFASVEPIYTRRKKGLLAKLFG